MTGFVWRRVHTIVAAGTGRARGRRRGSGDRLPRRLRDGGNPPAATASRPMPPPEKPTPTAVPSTPTADPVDPLTGGKPSAGKVVAVKVENIAAARPQVGLNPADIVFAEEVEGSLTRLVAGSPHTGSRSGSGRCAARATPMSSCSRCSASRVWSTPGQPQGSAQPRQVPDRAAAAIRSGRLPGGAAQRVRGSDAVAGKAKVGRARPIGWTFAADDPRWADAAEDASVSARVGGDTFSFAEKGGRYVVRWNGKTYADGTPARRPRPTTW